MMDAGLVIHRFSTADNATPMIRRLAGQISEARLYMLEDALLYWLAWYETTVPVPETGTEEWTPDADDLEAMSFDLRRDLSNPDHASSEIQWLYVVHTDVPDSVAVEYNAWYDEEHLPRLVRVPRHCPCPALRVRSGSSALFDRLRPLGPQCLYKP